MEEIDLNNSQTQAQPSYANFWVRFLAQILDTLFWWLNFFVPLYILSEFGLLSLNLFVTALLWFILYAFFVGPLIIFFIYPFLVSRFGGGVGKMLFGLEIINHQGLKLNFKDALFREYVAKSASKALFGLGYIWIFKSPQRQAWHDGLAGTFVVRKHNSLLTGFLSLIVVVAIIFGLCYKTLSNFKNAKTLGYDIITFMRQSRQDLTEYPGVID